MGVDNPKQGLVREFLTEFYKPRDFAEDNTGYRVDDFGYTHFSGAEVATIVGRIWSGCQAEGVDV